jgi:undecaprenyl diphosphate synthase
LLEGENMKIDPNKIPNHVAIILDGNGRWAKKRFLPRVMGHKEGAKNIAKVAKHASSLGISHLTVFCFSTENWNRPQDEVNFLMNLPVDFYKQYKDKILDSNIKIKVIGRRDRLRPDLVDIIEEIETKTCNNTKLTLTICLDYGSYDEITTAVKRVAMSVKNNDLNIDDITPEIIENNLFTKDYPKLDLLIRTSGEIRISNFLLWQLGYAELYFTDVFWPDFDEDELEKAIANYQSRNRRFGGLNDNK